MAGAALMVALPVLSACNGGGDPESDGTPTPKFSEAPSESASASASPLASGSAEPETPEQVARAFVSGVGDAINSGDTQDFLRYATDSCKNCAVVSDNIESRYTDGRTAESTGWRIATLRVKNETSRSMLLLGQLDAGSQRFIDANGEIYKREEAQTFRYQMLLAKRSGQWRVREWDLIP